MKALKVFLTGLAVVLSVAVMVAVGMVAPLYMRVLELEKQLEAAEATIEAINQSSEVTE